MDPGGGSLTVAKKKAKPRGVGRLVRIEPSVYSQAQFIARARGIAIGDYLSDVSRGTVARDYLAEQRRLEKEGKI